jgi:multicomponent K+:H+ antiporter subunit F
MTLFGMPLIDAGLAFAALCYGLALLMNMVRIARGPGTVERVLALDTMAVNMIALIVLYGIQTGSPLSFEAAMLFAMTGFVGTVAYCKFMLRGDLIE